MDTSKNPLFSYDDNVPFHVAINDVVFCYDLRDKYGACTCEPQDSLGGLEQCEFELKGSHYRMTGYACCVRKEMRKIREG